MKRAPGTQIKCKQTKAIFAWFEKLKGMIQSKHAALVSEAAHKVDLYLGHVMRTEVQQRRIRKLEAESLEEGSHEAWLKIDFKQKLNPCEYQEAGILHYGKRGMSCHGAALIFRNAEGQKEIHWLDTVVQGDAKQDAGMTIAILDELIDRVREILGERASHIRTFSLQSDNASNYQSHLLVLMIQELCKGSGARCSRIIHTESQDGKCIVDGHFQKVGWQVEKFVVETQGHCMTPMQVVDAFKHKGGIPSTSMACVKLNREKLAALEARLEKVKYAVSKVFTVTSPLEVRFATDSRSPDTLHATSASPAAQVVKGGGRQMKQLMAYLDAHPLCLTLEYFEKLQAAAKAPPPAGATKRARARRQPAPAAKRRKTAAAARPARSMVPQPARTGEIARIRALEPGPQAKVRMQFPFTPQGRATYLKFFAGIVEGYHTHRHAATTAP